MMMKTEQDHDRSGINQDLDGGDEVGIQSQKQDSHPQETEDHGKGAGHRIPVDHHADGTGDGHSGKKMK